jgi:hypothetical protein
VLPISTKIERAKCKTDCVLHDWREAGLRKASYVKCNPITLKQNELVEYVGRITDADLADVLSVSAKRLFLTTGTTPCLDSAP